MSGLGITAGAHRLWAHRSYKARLPLRMLLTFFNTIAFQDCAIHWARDHRVHHKYSETDADPHNATRYVYSYNCHSTWMKKKPFCINLYFIHFFFFFDTVDSFLHMLDGCYVKSIQKLRQRAKESICLTLKTIQS